MKKYLSGGARAAIGAVMQERQRLALLDGALQASIERIIEKDTGVDLDKQHWELDLQAGCISREKPDAG